MLQLVQASGARPRRQECRRRQAGVQDIRGTLARASTAVNAHQPGLSAPEVSTSHGFDAISALQTVAAATRMYGWETVAEHVPAHIMSPARGRAFRQTQGNGRSQPPPLPTVGSIQRRRAPTHRRHPRHHGTPARRARRHQRRRAARLAGRDRRGGRRRPCPAGLLEAVGG
jgi:hypothetical protein